MKRPRTRKSPGQARIAARETPRQSTNRLRPIFSLYNLAAGFSVSDCQPNHKAEFAQRLEELSRLTWGEIVQAPRRGLGSETFAQNTIRVPIPDFVTPDVTLLSWRFGGAARIIGYRDDQVLHIVWVDPATRSTVAENHHWRSPTLGRFTVGMDRGNSTWLRGCRSEGDSANSATHSKQTLSRRTTPLTHRLTFDMVKAKIA
jgi:hypothetical protein